MASQRKPKTVPHWDSERMREIRAGADPDGLRAFDRKGMSATTFAVIDTNVKVDAIQAELTALGKSEPGEDSQLDKVVQLLEVLLAEVQALRDEVRGNTIALGRSPASRRPGPGSPRGG